MDMASVTKMSSLERVKLALNVAKSSYGVEPLLIPRGRDEYVWGARVLFPDI